MHALAVTVRSDTGGDMQAMVEQCTGTAVSGDFSPVEGRTKPLYSLADDCEMSKSNTGRIKMPTRSVRTG
jgi:hypothetical protein